MNAFMHNTISRSFSDNFVQVSEVIASKTRFSFNLNNLYISRYKTKNIQRSTKYQNLKA